MRCSLADADTSVFWDVEDFPVDKLEELGSKIEAALEKIGCRGGKVSITAYGEEKPDHDLDRYKDAGITFVPRGTVSFTAYYITLCQSILYVFSL